MIRTTVFCLLVAIFASPLSAADPLPPIARRLPPKGLEIPAEVRRELEKELGEVKTKLAALSNGVEFEPDIAIYTKAVELALHFGEFYNAKHFDLAKASLATAKKRIAEMSQNNELSWRKARGLVVRGYRSEIDGSSQPYGLEIAEGIDLAKPTPLVVWLHGRGDQQTDLHFLADRAKGKSQFQIPGAIILHPFGRHCLGFKSAGEIDVLEAIEHVCREYSIDRNRIVMAGFSMGGAGSWHLGAHYADRWCAIAPGAGFAETRRYQNLDPAKVEWYERKLWGAYDVPDYARNLLHTPLIAYSGEIDKQKQAADVMAESLLSHGYKLRHLIGPKVGHQYEKETLKQLLAEVEVAVKQGRVPMPKSVSLQTRTLRYSKMHWVQVLALDEHWRDSRVDAELADDGSVTLKTQNIAALQLLLENDLRSAVRVAIDGEKLLLPHRPASGVRPTLVKEKGKWSLATKFPLDEKGRRKRPGAQGPIDDAFLSRFVVVGPQKKSKYPAIQAWVDFELARFKERWRGVFRGEVIDETNHPLPHFLKLEGNIIAFGEPDTNRFLAGLRVDKDRPAENRPPIYWEGEEIVVSGRNERYSAATHVPLMIRPRGEGGDYWVCNSGPTFREAHDGTNSQQNPKLPDWAIIDVSTPPSDKAPGRIVAAGFFDENWRVKAKESED